MASKIIKMNIDNVETEIVIRRIKKKELKTLAGDIGQTADSWIKFFDNNDFLSQLGDFVTKNIDYVSDSLILPFVTLTDSQLDEMDVVDIIDLFKELLAYNKVDIVKIVNFLKPDPTTLKKTAEMLSFSGATIPSVN